MKILELDLKRGMAKLVVENPDALWHLYNIISEGDLVYARTSRKIGGRSEATRPSRGRRVGLTLGIKVKNVDFDQSLNRLRVLGVIFEAPEKYDGLLGSHHTITISPNSMLRIVKDRWYDYQVERLRRAAAVEEKPVIVVFRKMPKMEKIFKALERFADKDLRKELIKKAGRIYKAEHIFFQCAGIEASEAKALIKKFSIHSNLPEPVRMAHLIASAITLGRSTTP